MEDNNKSEIEVLPPETTTVVEAANNAPIDVEGLPNAEQLVRLVIPQAVDKPLWRILMSGHMKPPRTEPKPIKFWYQGRLITREEHDKLSVDEILASNNKV